MSKLKDDAIPVENAAPPPDSPLVADRVLDITREICPMTFVRTRLALDSLAPGAILLVRLRGDEPRVNVPRTAEAQGHNCLAMTTGADGVTELWLRRG